MTNECIWSICNLIQDFSIWFGRVQHRLALPSPQPQSPSHPSFQFPFTDENGSPWKVDPGQIEIDQEKGQLIVNVFRRNENRTHIMFASENAPRQNSVRAMKSENVGRRGTFERGDTVKSNGGHPFEFFKRESKLWLLPMTRPFVIATWPYHSTQIRAKA
jgi:hypothetical protein